MAKRWSTRSHPDLLAVFTFRSGRNFQDCMHSTEKLASTAGRYGAITPFSELARDGLHDKHDI